MYVSMWIFPGFTKYCKDMIDGHGDDAYRYEGIRSDFSSNICPHADYQRLMGHLAACPELMGHYPEPEAWSLEEMIAQTHGIAPDQVIVTSGATEAIYLIAQTFRMRHVMRNPTFREYEDACLMFSRHDEDGQMMWLCNPNNPTGEVYDQSYIRQMAAQYDLLVIDQSYEYYTDLPVMPPCQAVTLPRVVQIHSLTKTYAVPGLRLGYITAPSALTRLIRRNMRPWSVSAIAIEAGKYLLTHSEMICKPDFAEAQRLRTNLLQTGYVEVEDTHTNFILCAVKDCTAAQLKDYLAKKKGLLIRDASNFKGLTARHFRVAAQLPEENDALVAAIKDFMVNRRYE